MEHTPEITIVPQNEPPAHPFFEKNDIAVLSMVTAILSPRAQKLLSFFLNFDNNESVSPLGSIGNILSQFSQNSGNINSAMMNMAPMFVELLSKNNKDSQNSTPLNPMLISSLLNAFASVKPPENK